MEGALNFFNSMDFLEPKCPKCKAVLEYGITTRFDDTLNSHICLACGHVLK